tara:strand:+ start:1260 stop:2114 length:855 start_codon:yes stop_codon:yes gene_type:complete
MSKPELPAEDNQIEDYLEEDKSIPGQKYVCLSFISPEKVLDDKKTYNYYHFLKKQMPAYTKTYAEFKEEFNFYMEDNEEKLQEEFDELVDYQTNVRGVKVRGVYDNLRAANIRAKVLQKLDRSFHVYVGQVGFWLPWDPTANNVEDQEYAEPELNRLVKEYKENETKKDMFYEEQKREKQKAAMEESLKLKEQQKLEMEAIAQEKEKAQLERDAENEKIISELESAESAQDVVTGEEEVNNVSIKTTPASEQTKMSSENVVDEELKESLNSVDPWMARKMEGEN